MENKHSDVITQGGSHHAKRENENHAQQPHNHQHNYHQHNHQQQNQFDLVSYVLNFC